MRHHVLAALALLLGCGENERGHLMHEIYVTDGAVPRYAGGGCVEVTGDFRTGGGSADVTMLVEGIDGSARVTLSSGSIREVRQFDES